MSTAVIGYEYPRQEVSWRKRDVLLFAVSIGCTVDELHFLYELHPHFSVFPTYALILPFKKTAIEVIDFYESREQIVLPGLPKFDSRRVVDGERQLQVFKPLPTTSEGRHFETRTKVLGVYDKGKPGTALETETLIVDRDNGEVFTRVRSIDFFVGQGGWGGPKGPATVHYPPPKGRELSPDAISETQLTSESAHLYRLNGDYNPLHATPEPGRAMGFGGAIMHGLCSWNIAAHALLKELGKSDPANMKEFQARFAAPVRPRDSLTTRIWKTGDIKDGWEEARFTVQVDSKVVLSNGRALIKSTADHARL